MKMYYSATNNSFHPDQLKSSYLSAGTWPKDAVEVSKEEWEIFGKTQPPEGMKRGPDSHGRPSWVPVPATSIHSLASNKRREIDAARDEAFSNGLSFDFNGESDAIQIRPEDKANLLAIAMEARDLKTAGESSPVIDFRTASNTTYQLTPNQAIDMTNAALAHVKAIYEQSWQLKDALDAALQAGDREAIEKLSWEAYTEN